MGFELPPHLRERVQQDAIREAEREREQRERDAQKVQEVAEAVDQERRDMAEPAEPVPLFAAPIDPHTGEASMKLPDPDAPLTGKYHGNDATPTERVSGEAVERENFGPLRAGGAGHRALAMFREGSRMTAYDASVVATGDFHAIRREATRLVVRGYLGRDGVLPNRAPRGREHVIAYRITDAGRAELARLDSIAT